MPTEIFSWTYLNDMGVSEEEIKRQELIGQDAYLVEPSRLNPHFQEDLQLRGYDLARKIKVYGPVPPPHVDAWVFEQ